MVAGLGVNILSTTPQGIDKAVSNKRSLLSRVLRRKTAVVDTATEAAAAADTTDASASAGNVHTDLNARVNAIVSSEDGMVIKEQRAFLEDCLEEADECEAVAAPVEA